MQFFQFFIATKTCPTDQAFKQFYAKIVKLASLCQFDQNFRNTGNIRVVAQLLLVKVVFESTDISAQRKLMEETDLTLACAIYGDLLSITKKLLIFLQRPRFHLYSMLSARSHKLRTPKLRVLLVHPPVANLLSLTVPMSKQCNYNHFPDHRCPAEGKHFNFCHGIGHFERVCFQKQR